MCQWTVLFNQIARKCTVSLNHKEEQNIHYIYIYSLKDNDEKLSSTTIIKTNYKNFYSNNYI